jgi:hypothetical protein
VDLLVPAYLTNQGYRVAPRVSSWAGNVREWIRGEQVLYKARDPEPRQPGQTGMRFSSPATPGDIASFVQFMPEDRARRVVQDYYREDPEE